MLGDACSSPHVGLLGGRGLPQWYQAASGKVLVTDSQCIHSRLLWPYMKCELGLERWCYIFVGAPCQNPAPGLLCLPFHASAAAGLGLALLLALLETEDEGVIPSTLPGPQQGETPAVFPCLRMQEARLHGNPFAMLIFLHSKSIHRVPTVG